MSHVEFEKKHMSRCKFYRSRPKVFPGFQAPLIALSLLLAKRLHKKGTKLKMGGQKKAGMKKEVGWCRACNCTGHTGPRGTSDRP